MKSGYMRSYKEKLLKQELEDFDKINQEEKECEEDEQDKK